MQDEHWFGSALLSSSRSRELIGDAEVWVCPGDPALTARRAVLRRRRAPHRNFFCGCGSLWRNSSTRRRRRAESGNNCADRGRARLPERRLTTSVAGSKLEHAFREQTAGVPAASPSLRAWVYAAPPRTATESL